MAVPVPLLLFIVTSHGLLGDTGIPTGWFLSEVAHPYNMLMNDYNLAIASPLGGPTPMDPSSAEKCKDDPECIAFLANPIAMEAMNTSIPLDQIDSTEYEGVFLPGGHGPMLDL